jgi:hypothetical protein
MNQRHSNRAHRDLSGQSSSVSPRTGRKEVAQELERAVGLRYFSGLCSQETLHWRKYWNAWRVATREGTHGRWHCQWCMMADDQHFVRMTVTFYGRWQRCGIVQINSFTPCGISSCAALSRFFLSIVRPCEVLRLVTVVDGSNRRRRVVSSVRSIDQCRSSPPAGGNAARLF